MICIQPRPCRLTILMLGAVLVHVGPALALTVTTTATIAPAEASATVANAGFAVPPPVFGETRDPGAAAQPTFPGIAFFALVPGSTQEGPSAPDPRPLGEEAPQATPPQKPPHPTEPIEVPVVSERSPDHTGFKALVRDTVNDFKHLPSRDTAMWLAIGGGLSVAVSPLDDEVNDRLQGEGWGAFFAPGKYMGYGWVQIGAAIGTWAIGRKVDKRGRAAHLGLDLLRAQIVTQTLTYALKVAVGRERPDGSGNDSFPSGHASTTWATATVLERHLGWKAAVPTYLAATYVATSRLHENRHHLSDVVFGATVGLVAGRTVTRHGRHSYALIPISGPRGGVGIGIARVAD